MFRLLILTLLLCGVADGGSYSSSRSSSSRPSSSASRSYSSSKSTSSYSSSSGKSYSSGSPSTKPSNSSSGYSSGSKSVDSSAASAQKAQQGKTSYTSYKAAKAPKVETPRYKSTETEYRTRNDRQKVVFNSYYNTRPTVVYRDHSWNPYFWMWLMDRRDQQAEWVYHHRSEISEERYRDLLAQNVNLESQLKDLESQKLARNPNYAPKDVDRDLMYASDNAAPEKDYTWVVVSIIVISCVVLVGGLYLLGV